MTTAHDASFPDSTTPVDGYIAPIDGGGPPPLEDASTTPDASPFGDASVLMMHLHPSRDGFYADPKITQSAAATLTPDTGFSATYSGQTYAQPLFVDGFRPGQDALFVVTTDNQVAAFDATTGATIWSRTLGAPVSPAVLPCNQPSSQVYGILSTPVIDAPSRTIFTEAFVGSGDGGKTVTHYAYALSIDDGTVRPGWPVDVGMHVSGFDNNVQHQRGALIVLGGRVYFPYSGIAYDCDPPDYRGRVVGISLTDPSDIRAWTTTANAGGVWSALASDGTDLFFSTGNNQDAGVWAGGDSVIRMSPNLVFEADTTSYFTPSNWQTLDAHDLDLGAASLLLVDLPDASPSSLAVAMGKAGTVHLVDRANLGGVGTGNGSTGEGLYSAKVVSGVINGNPATYQTTMGRYVVLNAQAPGIGCPAGTSGELVALRLSVTSPPTFSVAWCASSQGQGAPIATTTDGASNPIVWIVGAQGTNELYGFDGDTGALLFNGHGTSMTQVLRWTSPIVAKGRLFVGATGRLYAFNVPL